MLVLQFENARVARWFRSALKIAGAMGMAGALCAAVPAQAKADEDDPYGDASEINTGALGPAAVGFSNLFSSLQRRSEEHPSELQSLMRISYAVFCLKKQN